MNLELNYKGFENNLFKKFDRTDILGREGVQYIFKFDNGYGASVIKCSGSYGYYSDLWELGVIWFEDDDYDLTYNTPITDDVIGDISNERVVEILGEIKELHMA